MRKALSAKRIEHSAKRKDQRVRRYALCAMHFALHAAPCPMRFALLYDRTTESAIGGNHRTDSSEYRMSNTQRAPERRGLKNSRDSRDEGMGLAFSGRRFPLEDLEELSCGDDWNSRMLSEG